jgi:hypothetical protein
MLSALGACLQNTKKLIRKTCVVRRRTCLESQCGRKMVNRSLNAAARYEGLLCMYVCVYVCMHVCALFISFHTELRINCANYFVRTFVMLHTLIMSLSLFAHFNCP